MLSQHGGAQMVRRGRGPRRPPNQRPGATGRTERAARLAPRIPQWASRCSGARGRAGRAGRQTSRPPDAAWARSLTTVTSTPHSMGLPRPPGSPITLPATNWPSSLSAAACPIRALVGRNLRTHYLTLYGHKRPAKTQGCIAVSPRLLIRMKSEVQVLPGPRFGL